MPEDVIQILRVTLSAIMVSTAIAGVLWYLWLSWDRKKGD